jgi:error-prone DNA polymerase
LFCRTNYSFLEGASHPDELVTRASELGYAALAVTDRNSLAGVVRAHVAAKAAGLKLLIGAMLTPEDSSPLLVWAPDRPAYGRLARMITHGRRAAPKGECYLRFADVASYAQGLLAGVLLTEATGPDLARYRDLFGDGCYAIATLACGPHDRRRLREMAERAAVAGVPMLAANDVHYHSPRRRPLHDVLTAIRHGCTVAELGHRGFGNAQRHLIKPADMLALFADCPDAVTRTVEVADRCRFNLDELRYDYPEELCPAGLTPGEYLAQLTWAGAKRRYPTGIPDKVRRLIEHELTLIGELHYEAYFLTVWDLVRFARSRDILCQGRGSAANSAVCYCLGVTAVDPDRIDVLFERFVSKERNEAPDIDVDFEHERREEVLQYIYDKYGRERAGMTAEVITYRERSAVREVGKALGLSPDRADRLAKTMDHHPRRDEDRLASRVGETGLNPGGRLGRQLIALVQQLIGFPRHLSQHVGGMVLTHRPLCELVPIENAAMPGRTVIQWDKDDLDALGILKVDCLSLGMLTAIRKCFHLVGPDKAGEILTLATIPPEDHIVYDMVCRADTIGVFQIESRAQMAMLPRLRPRCFYDLVIEVAIVRPGPIQGKMVHPYLRRRRGDEPIDYPNEAIRAVLEKTMGVPIFQEQAMRLAVVGAGFTPGEADQLRRAMGAWRRRGVMEPFREKLIRGMQANGLTVDFAERVYQQICGFGEYGFPESHAASFALLVYVSAWLKCYYPAAFTAAILNSLPMGFYAPAQLVADARKHGVEIRPIDVNHSHWDCTLESVGDRAPALRLGFRLVTGLHQSHADQIVTARACGAFRSFAEFVRRTGLRGGALRRLSRADVFRSLPLGRREAFWRALPERDPPNLFDNVEPDATPAPLPAMTSFEEVLADYTTTSLSLRQHPISFLRPYLKQLGATPAGQLPELPHERQVTVAGLVLLRQRPSTANGITFVTLEDETGMVNLIVRQVVWERYRNVARAATALLAHGEIQRDPNVIHVLVTKLEDMTSRLAELRTHSRDFH